MRKQTSPKIKVDIIHFQSKENSDTLIPDNIA